jgi:hypothetical protein
MDPKGPGSRRVYLPKGRPGIENCFACIRQTGVIVCTLHHPRLGLPGNAEKTRPVGRCLSTET